MDVEYTESRRELSEERHQEESPVREHVGFGEDDREKSSKHRSKDRKKSRREEKDHRSRESDGLKLSDKDVEKQRVSGRDKRREDREEHEKDKSRDRAREKDSDRDKHREKGRKDRDKRDRAKERDPEMQRETEEDGDHGRENERSKEKSRVKDKGRDNEKVKDRDRTKDGEKHRDREKDRDHDRVKDRDIADRDKGNEKLRENKEADQDNETYRDREKHVRRNRVDGRDRSKDGRRNFEDEDSKEETGMKQNSSTSRGKDVGMAEQERTDNHVADSLNQGASEIEERILRMKEERLKKSSGGSEILAWVSRSRKVGEKEKALQRSKILEEQDNIEEDNSGDESGRHAAADGLAGVKVLHGLDKVMEGGSVVLTLKDQEILANGDINEDLDMLENVELGEQKRRNEAYNAAKKKTGFYDDKFNDETGMEKKMLPQYDEPSAEEGLTLDASGRFAAEAQKKLEELRKRLQGGSVSNQFQDLNSSLRVASDYYTNDEMIKFKKPKKKKSLRKKDKLDLDALEAEARSAGLGDGDLGSRNDAQRQAAKEEQEKSEAERRKNAYDAAHAKAEEASKALRMDQTLTVKKEEDDTEVFADDAEDLQKALERARKLALKKQSEEKVTGPEAIARVATSDTNNQPADGRHPSTGETSENMVVFTEMEEFVWGLQLDEEAQKPETEDVFMEEDEAPKAPEEDTKVEEAGGWSEVKDSENEDQPKDEDMSEVVPDTAIHEVPVGKGLSGALKLLQERGSLKETVEWGGRNMDKKKSKLVGIYDEAAKEINIERTDEYGRILTPKEAFRLLSHKFHGKGPGKMKQEKRMKQYQDELKLKQMKNNDTPSQSVERMREAQEQMKTPYLVISGNVKPGQTSDPRSGFATVEKDLPGGLTPMLGDKKVEHFLGIKRKAEPGNSGTPKKPKT